MIWKALGRQFGGLLAQCWEGLEPSWALFWNDLGIFLGYSLGTFILIGIEDDFLLILTWSRKAKMSISLQRGCKNQTFAVLSI